MIEINMTSPVINIKIKLVDRITILKGDSGTGKTVLVNTLISNSELVRVEKSDDYAIRLVGNDYYKDITELKKSVLIFDDSSDVDTASFLALCNSFCDVNDNYILIVGRDLVGSKISFINIALRSIYRLKNDGINYYLENYYIDNKPTSLHPIIIEDSVNGYKFFSNYFSDVTSSHGKDNLIDVIIKSKNNKVWILFDTLSAGNIIDRILSVEKEIFWDINYGSFEEFLLETNAINKVYIPVSINPERVTKEIISKSSNSKYKVTKSTISKCFLLDCCYSQQLKEKCEFAKTGNKLELLVNDTKFEYISRFNSSVIQKLNLF